jgi:hypothetical protein
MATSPSSTSQRPTNSGARRLSGTMPGVGHQVLKLSMPLSSSSASTAAAMHVATGGIAGRTGALAHAALAAATRPLPM